MTLSKNGIGLAAAILAALGLDVPEMALAGAWEGILSVVSLILLVWNQLGRPDIKAFFFKGE